MIKRDKISLCRWRITRFVHGFICAQFRYRPTVCNYPCLPGRTLMTERGLIVTDESKLKLYETIYIVRPNLDEEGVDKTINAVEEFMKAQGVIIDLTDKKGRKRLAYEVKKMRDGYFVHSVLRAPAEAIAPVRRMMSLSEDVIRSLIVAIPPIALEVQAQL